jgi:hypothetical protein
MIKNLKRTECETETARKGNRKVATSFVKPLAEAIILQCMEDYIDPEHRNEGIEFFSGEGFVICADIAEINVNERYELIMLMKRATGRSIECEREG